VTVWKDPCLKDFIKSVDLLNKFLNVKFKFFFLKTNVKLSFTNLSQSLLTHFIDILSIESLFTNFKNTIQHFTFVKI